MTLVPLTECCLHLGIDPKTLRFWLKAAHLSCCLHPADARLKCLTHDQLIQLAHLHDRRLLLQASPAQALPPASPVPAIASSDGPSADPSPALVSREAVELRHQLTLLAAQVATLQAQVTELALALLRSSSSQFSPDVRSSVLASNSTSSPTSHAPSLASRPTPKAVSARLPASASSRARSRALPLIEARPDGSYVVIAPDSGVVPLVPDSAEWFAWLASLSGFSFQGTQGSFGATRKFRKGQRIQSWNIHRSLHGRSCTLYLGLTPTLTLARLEAMAATAHTRLTTP